MIGHISSTGLPSVSALTFEEKPGQCLPLTPLYPPLLGSVLTFFFFFFFFTSFLNRKFGGAVLFMGMNLRGMIERRLFERDINSQVKTRADCEPRERAGSLNC